jgi:Calcineurin-like phosphoesterase
MVLVLFGDTHELHREVEVPAGDILICVGDFTMFSKSLSAIEDFNEWLGELPHRHKIVVPGNHEFFLEANPERRSLLDNANVLIDEGIEIEGLSIYGSPMTPLHGAAFGKVYNVLHRIRVQTHEPGRCQCKASKTGCGRADFIAGFYVVADHYTKITPVVIAQVYAKGSHKSGDKKYLSADAKILTASVDDTVADDPTYPPLE